MLIFLIGCSLYSSAQYYPAPQPVDRKNESILTRKLSTVTDQLTKADLLIDLANINYYKPERKPAFVKKAVQYALEASTVSQKLNNTKKFNQSQYILALCYLIQNDFKAAEALVSGLDDPTKNDLLVSIAFKTLDIADNSDTAKVHKAAQLLDQARLFSIKMKNKKNEMTCRLYLIMADHILNAKMDPVPALEQLVAEYKKTKIVGLHYVYQSLAGVYNERSLNDKSLYYIQEAIKEMHGSGDLVPAGDFYNGLGIIFKQEGENDKEMEAKLTSLSYYKLRPTSGNIIGSINSITMAFIHQKKYQESINFLNKNLKEYPPETEDEKMSVASAYGNAYLALKNYQLAEKYFLQRFQMNLKATGPTFSSYDRMGYFYIESKQYEKAGPYLKEALRLKTHLVSPNAISSLQFRMYLVDSAAGSYLSAMKHLSATHSFADSVLKAKKNTEISELLVKYEDEKKKSEIRSLKQKGQLDAANVKRAKLIENITIAGIIIVLLVGGLFYRQYRNKQKLNLEIISKNKHQEILLFKLNRLLSEKEWLLKEVHHRVKNNLHTIISLLNIQAEFLKDDALLAIENSQHRIYAMSLIHQKLYATDDIQTIDMFAYVTELVEYLKNSFGEQEHIKYLTEIDPLFLDVGQAMPLGLIINEAVTNSIKYAFPKHRDSTISISLKSETNRITMVIADNGIGIPQTAQNAKLSSLGLKLIEGLSGDINAEFRIENDNGTKISITFEPDYLQSLKIVEKEEMA